MQSIRVLFNAPSHEACAASDCFFWCMPASGAVETSSRFEAEDARELNLSTFPESRLGYRNFFTCISCCQGVVNPIMVRRGECA